MKTEPNPVFLENATTFADLFNGYLLSWPEAVVEAHHEKWPTTKAYGDHLLQLATRVATEFPHIDLWDRLESALRHSMRWYDAKKGPFDKFFEQNLREMLRKATMRAEVSARRRRRTEKEYALRRSGWARNEQMTSSFDRWTAILLDRASQNLDPMTRSYVAQRRNGVRVRAIAAELGVSD